MRCICKCIVQNSEKFQMEIVTSVQVIRQIDYCYYRQSRDCYLVASFEKNDSQRLHAVSGGFDRSVALSYVTPLDSI
jgi:hypothetical protein